MSERDDVTLEALLDRIEQLERDLAEVRGRPPEPELEPAAQGATPTGASRRALLGGAVAGAAGLVVGALVGAEPAAATTGAMQFGATNNAGSTETVLSSSNVGSTFRAANIASGNGLEGTAGAANGVEGTATSGTGVWGVSTSGVGVRAVSTSGTGLLVTATNAVGVDARSDQVQLHLQPSVGRGAPTGDAFAHRVGDVVGDDAGDLWYCTAAGTPGTWRKLSGPKAAGALHLLPAPVRVYDSRSGTLPAVGLKTPFAGGEVRTLDCKANSSSVPSSASGALVTCMVLNAAAGNGNFTVWSASQAKPAATTMVWGGSAGRFSTLAVSALGPGAQVKVSPSVACDVAVDVVGYMR